jgi:hypothetical protein
MRFRFYWFVLAATFLPLCGHSQSSPVHVAGNVIARNLAQEADNPGTFDGATAAAFSFARFVDEAKPIRTLAFAQCNVAAETMPGSVVSRPVPQYSDDEKVSGESVFRIVIGRDGAVKHATMLTGPPERKDADLRAVRQWKFEPARRNGKPAEIVTSISVVSDFGTDGD